MAGLTNLIVASDRLGMGNPTCKTGRLDRIVSLLSDVDRFSEAGEDNLYEHLLVIVEVACKFYYSVRQKLTEAEAAVHSAEDELGAVRKDPFKSCSKCVDLEKELSTYKKKLQENESRIKSIASILSLHSSQDLEEDSSNPHPSSVSRACHLVSQMLLDTKDGSAKIKKRRRSDSLGVENIQPETLAVETMKLEMNSGSSNVCVPETIYPDGKELFSTPHKGGPSQKEKFSPVLGSATKRSLGKKDHDEVGDLGVKVLDTTCVSPSLLKDTSTGAPVQKKQADFWQLRTTHSVDVEPIRSMRTRKLKQAQLVLGCHSKNQDVSSLSDFNGGIRPNRTSTQLPRKKEILDENEILDRAIRESLKESRMQPTDDDVIEKSPCAEHPRLKSVSDSPDYKYRGKAVRKKAERRQLPGWDCDQCKKYYEAVGGNQEQHLGHCSKHRDKFPVKPLTPPGFWNADFPSTQECRARNMDVTHYDTSNGLEDTTGEP